MGKVKILAIVVAMSVLILAGCQQVADQSTTVQKTFADYPNYSDLFKNSTEVPADLVKVQELGAEECPANADGPCGFKMFVMANKGWENVSGEQDFYFAKEGGACAKKIADICGDFYGPMKGDLKELTK